jgi:cation:H+ antiporter
MPSALEFSLTTNLAMFSLGAAAVWFAGFRISRYADQISAKTGIGHALLGLLLLGGVTSLPEFAVAVTSSVKGNAALAVSTVMGGVAMQVAILALADFVIGRRALTSVVPDPIVLLQGSLSVVLLSFAAFGAIAGDRSILGVGLWSWAILGMFIASIRLLSKAERRQPWLANLTDDEKHARARAREQQGPEEVTEDSLAAVLAKTAAAGASILVAGFVVSQSGEAIAEQTGLGQSFVGAVLVAISTSLPEVSTVLSAVRLGLFTMAVSDILGTNLFDLFLLFVVDAISPGEPVLQSVGTFAAAGAVLGILVTALLLVGLVERRERTVCRFGIDSIAVLVAYSGGLVLLYGLR